MKFNFSCPKCKTLVQYDMSMGVTAKDSNSKICKCPECKTIIVYSNVVLQRQTKKGKK